MKSQILTVAAVAAAVLLVSRNAGSQQTTPDLARIFEQSEAYQKQDTLDGCRWRYDKGSRKVVCVKRILVTLTAGEQTVVSNPMIRAGSHVQCGCGADGAALPAGTPTPTTSPPVRCNERARWLGRYSVNSITNGSFVLYHSWARGDEQMACEIG